MATWGSAELGLEEVRSDIPIPVLLLIPASLPCFKS
jgi:hypothetical protein